MAFVTEVPLTRLMFVAGIDWISSIICLAIRVARVSALLFLAVCRPTGKRPIIPTMAKEKIANESAVGMMLEKAVRNRPQAIVGAGARLAHRILRAWIVEAGENDERAITDIAVGMLGDRLQERRHGLRGDGSSDCTGRAGTNAEIEVAELADGGFQLVCGDGLRGVRFLRHCGEPAPEDTKDTQTEK